MIEIKYLLTKTDYKRKNNAQKLSLPSLYTKLTTNKRANK